MPRRRRVIGEDERQPVMARLAARWRRSNLAKLVTLKKGNHPGKAFSLTLFGFRDWTFCVVKI